MGSKQPKLVLRESCIADRSRGWPPGRFVEMGAGTGQMTAIFLARGFHGACHDLGDDSRELLRRNLATHGTRIEVVDSLQALPDAGFDYLFAFEVLEHIEDDAGVLADWARKVRPGGRLLVSVPAHQRKFGRSDQLVGHVRRYERDELRDLLASAGFADIDIVNYGFPITELTRRFSNFLVRNDRTYDRLSPEERSIRSAQAKPATIAKWLKLFSGSLAVPFCTIQRWSYRHDVGDGLVATAIRRA